MPHLLLLVDDEPKNLSTLETILAPWGFDTRAATSLPTSLELFTRDTPDAVLVGLSARAAGGLDAFEVLARLRAHAHGADVPVVLIAAEADDELHRKALDCGASDFLSGPPEAVVLAARLRMLLSMKQARDALKQSRDGLAERQLELESARRDQHALMEFLVHDLKNPMMVVTGNLEWLRASEGISSRLIEAIDDARDAAARIRSMVENFLMVSRLEHAQFPLCPESVEVDGLFRQVAASVAERARSQHVDVSFHADPGLNVTVDSMLLNRVINSMVDNALRNTPAEGRIALEAHRGDGVVIAISNSGPPIPLAERERLFDKLSRPSEPPSMLADSGLGLYFCKCAVEAHSGHISVFETGDWPTSFVIQLPVA